MGAGNAHLANTELIDKTYNVYIYIYICVITPLHSYTFVGGTNSKGDRPLTNERTNKRIYWYFLLITNLLLIFFHSSSSVGNVRQIRLKPLKLSKCFSSVRLLQKEKKHKTGERRINSEQSKGAHHSANSHDLRTSDGILAYMPSLYDCSILVFDAYIYIIQ